MSQKNQQPDDLEQAKLLRVEFMRAELDIAATFLELADTTRDLETRTRNLQNAWKAHHEVAKILAKRDCSDEHRAVIEGRLVELGEQLNARGVLPG